MICNNCKTEYDSHAITCPNCGAPNNSGKKKKMPIWMHIVAVLSVIVIFSYVFCFSKGVLFKDVDLFKDKDGKTYIDEYDDNGSVEIKGETTTEEPLRLPEDANSEKETLKDGKKKEDNKPETTKKTTVSADKSEKDKPNNQDSNNQDSNNQDSNNQDSNNQDTNNQDSNNQDTNNQDTNNQDTNNQDTNNSTPNNPGSQGSTSDKNSIVTLIPGHGNGNSWFSKPNGENNK